MIFFILYIVTALLWAVYSSKQQVKTFPNASKIVKTISFIANLVLCPIAIAVAYFANWAV